MDINKEMLKGYIESVILSQLRHEDHYGYEICRRIRDISEHTFEIKEGTLYIVLKRLRTVSWCSRTGMKTMRAAAEDDGTIELPKRASRIWPRGSSSGFFSNI
ncbi:hypothetical protein PCCS19_07610 [Paenibacillus sp. CCS19]|uniref:PadR family transcriptional regulator n=1 Tax=Paenibacillus sp. CCS19 TaxID=3158387 RepID=UPI002565EB2F|nr:PadR family transcriptional regulator [Paenibacillus cellulosilyticus]GMK37707.1 hypothetical protein PCCS19_07610 [Paenibacillus cellulosilyticus]